jgi:hypothetical protein
MVMTTKEIQQHELNDTDSGDEWDTEFLRRWEQTKREFMDADDCEELLCERCGTYLPEGSGFSLDDDFHDYDSEWEGWRFCEDCYDLGVELFGPLFAEWNQDDDDDLAPARANSNMRIPRDAASDGKSHGVGWKQQGNTAYEPLLALRTVYEFAEEDYDYYRVERQRIVDAIPREAEGSIVDGDIVLYAHLFNGSWDWYVAGYDPDEDIAFGYVMGLENEWGDFWLREVETTRFSQPVSINGGPTIRIPGALTECDIHWKPISFAELQARRGGGL